MSYALVTGASKGIGFHIAERLAGKGFDLLLIARNLAELEKAAALISSKYSVDIKCLPLDLSKRESPLKVLEYVQANALPVSILVNNAGYGVWGEFESTSLNAIVDMLEINMLTLVQLTHLLLPTLMQQRPGYILNIASTAAYQAVPTLSCYAASKSFVVLFSRGLDYELRKKGITVTCLSPGPTLTNFNQRAGIGNPVILKRTERFSMDAEPVADAAIAALFKRKKEVIPGWMNRISSALGRVVPKSMTELVAAGLYKS